MHPGSAIVWLAIPYRNVRVSAMCRWLDIDKPWVDNPAFIVHFAGCGMCSSGFHPERLGECDVEYIRIFAESFGHLKDAASQMGLAPSALPQAAWTTR